MVHDILISKDMVGSISKSKHDYVLSFEYDPEVEGLHPHDYVQFTVEGYENDLFGEAVVYMVTDVINSKNSEAIKAGWTVICVRPVDFGIIDKIINKGDNNE